MDGDIEYIPDEGKVSREVFHPQMTRDEARAVYYNLFEFSGGEADSVIWRYYCIADEDVHNLGLSHEAKKQERNPNVRYLGFGTAGVGQIRSISARNKDGHGFNVRHEPNEGIQHAEVCFQLSEGVPYGALTRGQKLELKFTLGRLFEPITPRT